MVGQQTQRIRKLISETTDDLKELLLEKNRRYGDSALNPLGVFTSEKDGAVPGLRARIDDKLARIAQADELRRNDVADLIGYLILLCVAKGWTSFKDLLD
mgnify:CR=1 FL=1